MATISENGTIEIGLNLTAPKFNLIDIYDRSIDLNNYLGKKVFIGFFRHAGCPFCNMRVHTLTKIGEELKEQGMEMIFFFESKKEVMLRSSFHQGVSPIPLIADPKRQWYDQYGIENSRSKSVVSHITTFVQTTVRAKINQLPVHPMADGESFDTMPAEFLLDENLIIRKLHYAKRLNDRLSLDLIREFARQ